MKGKEWVKKAVRGERKLSCERADVPRWRLIPDRLFRDAGSKIRLDKSGTRVDVDLAQCRLPGINEAVRRMRGNHDDAARIYLSLFISHRDGGRSFEGKRHFHVRMRMQARPSPGFRADDVGGEGRALRFTDELVGHPCKRQLVQTEKAHPCS